MLLRGVPGVGHRALPAAHEMPRVVGELNSTRQGITLVVLAAVVGECMYHALPVLLKSPFASTFPDKRLRL